METQSGLAEHLHNFFHVYLTTQRNLSPHTVLSYRDAIKLLLGFAARSRDKQVTSLVIEDLGVDMVLDFLDHLERERKNSIATRNNRLAALHTLYHHIAARDPQHFALCQRVLGIPAKRGLLREIHYLEREEMEAVLDAIDCSTAMGRRDYALVTFAWQTGARVAEIIGLRASDLQLDTLPLVRLWGKGRKERVVPLWPKAASLLRAWLEERCVDPRSPREVFVNQRGSPLTRWGVRYIIKKYVKIATAACETLADKRIHPHALRHTSAVHMLQSGVDPSAIRDILGHASAETTWRYTRVNLDSKRKAIDACAIGDHAADSPAPVWRNNEDMLAQLEAIGRGRNYVEQRGPGNPPTPQIRPPSKSRGAGHSP